MSHEPESLILQILRELRQDSKDLRSELKSEIAGVKSEMQTLRADVRSDGQSLRADVVSDLMQVEKRLGEQIATLRRAVMEYHSSAIGHGVLYGELEERLRRVEAHLNLDRDSH